MADRKSFIKHGRDEKDMKEWVLLESWPRLTAEDNKTRIDFGKGYTLDVRNMNFMDHDVLREIGRNLRLDVSDLTTLKANIMKLDGDFTAKHPQDREVKRDEEVSPNPKDVLLLYSSVSEFRIYLIQNGQLVYAEDRSDKGLLMRRAFFNKEIISYCEIYYYDGLLEMKGEFDHEGGAIGPFYYYDAPNYPSPYIEYNLGGKKISKKEWQDYVLQKQVMLRESKALISDVGAMINDYIGF